MQLICSKEMSLFFNIIPMHNTALLSSLQELKNSILAESRLLDSHLLMNKHFHFCSTVVCAKMGQIH